MRTMSLKASAKSSEKLNHRPKGCGPDNALTDEQVADLRKRISNPGPIASDAEVEAFFARFKP